MAKTLTYEQAVEMAQVAAREAVRSELGRFKPGGLLCATLDKLFERSAIDGVMTTGDVTVAVAGAIGVTAMGALIGVGLHLFACPLGTLSFSADKTLTFSTIPLLEWSAAIGLVKGGYEATNRIVRDLRCDWGQDEEAPEVVDHKALIAIQDSKMTRFLNLGGEQLDSAVEFARAYLALKGRSEDNPTAEKHWIGKGKLWANSDAGRGSWQEFKRFWIDKELAVWRDPQKQEGAWLFLASGEHVLRELAKIEL